MPARENMPSDIKNVSASIKAIQQVRALFESVHGNLGLLKFNIEVLAPINGKGAEESKKWKVICSFYETLSSTSPSRYEVDVDLSENTMTVKKLSGETTEVSKKVVGTWHKKE